MQRILFACFSLICLGAYSASLAADEAQSMVISGSKSHLQNDVDQAITHLTDPKPSDSRKPEDRKVVDLIKPDASKPALRANEIRYTSDTNGFSIILPGTPQFEFDETEGIVIKHAYVVNSGKSRWEVACIKPAKGVDLPLDGALAAFYPKSKERIGSVQTRGFLAGRERRYVVNVEGRPLAVDLRLRKADDFLYLLRVQTWDERLPQEEIDRFFQSLELQADLPKKPEAGLPPLKDAEAYIERGRAFVEKEEFEKAVEDFRTALKNPRTLEAQIAAMMSLLKLGDDDKVSKEVIGFYQRGLKRQERRQLDEAIVDFTEALRLAPDYAPAYFDRGLVWKEKKDDDRALADFAKASQLDTKNAGYVLARARLSLKKGDVAGAIAFSTKAIELKQERVPAYCLRGDAWATKGEDALAIDDWNTALRIDRLHRGAQRMIALTRATSQNAAIRDGNVALEMATKLCEESEWRSYQDLTVLAAAYAEKGEFSKAAEWQKKAVELAPRSLQSYHSARLELYSAGKPYRKPEQKTSGM